MKKMLVILFLFPGFIFAQKPTISRMEWAKLKSGWQYVAFMSNGDSVYKGKILILGKGSLPNGDYNYIATPSNTNEAKLKHSTTLKGIEVKYVNKKGNEKYGYKYIFQGQGNYLIQLENAIATEEIIL